MVVLWEARLGEWVYMAGAATEAPWGRWADLEAWGNMAEEDTGLWVVLEAPWEEWVYTAEEVMGLSVG